MSSFGSQSGMDTDDYETVNEGEDSQGSNQSNAPAGAAAGAQNAERLGLTDQEKSAFFKTLREQIESGTRIGEVLDKSQADSLVLLLDIFHKSDPNTWIRQNQWSIESCREYVDAIALFVITDVDGGPTRDQRKLQIDKIIEDMIHVSGIPIASAYELRVDKARRAFMFLFGIGASFATLHFFAPGCIPFILEYAYCLVNASPDNAFIAASAASSSSAAGASAAGSGISPSMIATSLMRAIYGSAEFIKTAIINLNEITFNASAAASVGASAAASAGMEAVANAITLDSYYFAAELAAAAIALPLATASVTRARNAYEEYDSTLVNILRPYFERVARGADTTLRLAAMSAATTARLAAMGALQIPSVTAAAARGTVTAVKGTATAVKGAVAVAKGAYNISKTAVSVAAVAAVAVDEFSRALFNYAINNIQSKFLGSVSDMCDINQRMIVQFPGELPNFPVEFDYANKKIRISLIEMYKYLKTLYGDDDPRFTMGVAFGIMSSIDYSTSQTIAESITRAAAAFGIYPILASSQRPMPVFFKDFMIFTLHWTLATQKMQPDMIVADTQPELGMDYTDIEQSRKQMLSRNDILRTFLSMNKCEGIFLNAFGNFFKDENNNEIIPHRTLGRLNRSVAVLTRSQTAPASLPSADSVCSKLIGPKQDIKPITYTPIPLQISDEYNRLLDEVFQADLEGKRMQINTAITRLATNPERTVNRELEQSLRQDVVDIICNAVANIYGFEAHDHERRLDAALGAVKTFLNSKFAEQLPYTSMRAAAASSGDGDQIVFVPDAAETAASGITRGERAPFASFAGPSAASASYNAAFIPPTPPDEEIIKKRKRGPSGGRKSTRNRRRRPTAKRRVNKKRKTRKGKKRRYTKKRR
jgi:hypothetical protein